jgi:hypothetical protein
MRYVLLTILLTVSLAAFAEDAEADLRLRIKNGESVTYVCTMNASTSSSGRVVGKPFTRSSETVITHTCLLKGLPAKTEGQPISIRLKDITQHAKESFVGDKSEKDAVDTSAEVIVSREKVKAIENGKVVVDSENDIGLDQIGPLQQQLKLLENSEAHMIVDATGRQGDVQGDALLVDAIREGGVSRIFPALPGKSIKAGESWEDNYNLPRISAFKLAKPAIVRSRLTFNKWETVDGRRLALIDVVCAWDRQELKGENEKSGMLVEISGIDSKFTGSCHFDAEAGHFVDLKLTGTTKYHIDSQQEDQTMGLDVSAKSEFSLTEKK